MSILVSAQSGKQIIVPVRLARAITGPAQFDAPDIDDRAFAMARPSGFASTDARGPMFGIAVGQSVRVKIVREDIDDSATLFATVENVGQPQIDLPDASNGGVQVPADGIIHVRAVADTSTGQRLQIRLGAVDGPVIAEAEPHVFQMLTVPITPHFVTINSSTSSGTAPTLDIARVLRRVRAIWRACAIDFSIQATQNDAITLPSNVLDTADANTNADIIAILNLQRQRLGLPAGTPDRTINWYIIIQFKPLTVGTRSLTIDGLGISRVTANSIGSDPGIISTTDFDNSDAKIEAVALATAHEIGHFFRLDHIQLQNADNPVTDSFGRRCLMFPSSPLPGTSSPPTLTGLPRVRDVGYGDLVQGQFIGFKKHFNTDSECKTSRNTIRSNGWF